MDNNNIYYALPESFDPLTTTLDFEQWVRKFKACAEANNWDEQAQLRHLPPLLRGDAWILYDELTAEEKATLAALVSALTNKLNVATQIQSAERLYQRVFDPNGESLLTYQNDVKRLAHRAYPDMTADQIKPIILTAFIRGLKGHSVALARKVRNSNPTTLQKALEKAQFILSDPFVDDQPEVPEVLAVKTHMTPDKVGDADYLRSDAEMSDHHEQNQDDSMPSWLPKLISAVTATPRKCDYCGKSTWVSVVVVRSLSHYKLNAITATSNTND